MDTQLAPPTDTVSTDDPPPQRIEVHIPFVTFVKVLAALLTAYVIYILWPMLLLVFLAIFLAVTLHALVAWLETKGLGHRASLVIVIGGLFVILGAAVALVVPTLIEQVTTFSHNLPSLREKALNRLPMGGAIRQNLDRIIQSTNWSEAGSWLGRFVSAGSIALGALSEVALLIVIALYMVVDGQKTFEYLLAYFSPLNRRKLRITSTEVSQMIFGYVAGQSVTSAIVATYTFIVLTVLHVPGALMLAMMAGIFDILPIVGIFISTVPAFLLALTISPQTAFIVAGMYVLFHFLEAYLIVPKVYGARLRVSTLTVLLALLAGSMLAGIPGALAALPIIGSYAAIERIWLKPYLRDGVSEKHELQNDQEFGEKAHPE